MDALLPRIRGMLASVARFETRDGNAWRRWRGSSQRSLERVPGIEAICLDSAEASRVLGRLEQRCTSSLRRSAPVVRRGSPNFDLNQRSLDRGVQISNFAHGYQGRFVEAPQFGLLRPYRTPAVSTSLTVLDGRLLILGDGGDHTTLLITDREAVTAANRYLDGLREIAVAWQPNWRRDDVRPTVRQQRIMALLVCGATDEVVAKQLGLTSRTIRTEVAALAAQLGVTGRLELGMAYAAWLDGR